MLNLMTSKCDKSICYSICDFLTMFNSQNDLKKLKFFFVVISFCIFYIFLYFLHLKINIFYTFYILYK